VERRVPPTLNLIKNNHQMPMSTAIAIDNAAVF